MNYYTPTYIFKQIAAVKRVRELHIPNPKYLGEHIPCVACKEYMPCPTIKALDGGK